MDEKNNAYTLTVYVAAPGTPLRDEATPSVAPIRPDDSLPSSTPGHMFYVIRHGEEENSYGFAPVEHGSIYGKGQRVRNDLKNYTDPYYERTLEITAQQFDRLQAFGEDPARYGFDLTYRDARNNCVDFTWTALHHAGIHPQRDGKDYVDFEGYLRPTHNIDAIRSIPPQMWGSPYDKQILRDLPEHRSLLQKALSENGTTPPRPGPHSSTDDLFDALYGAALAKDHVTERAVGQAYAQTDAGRALFAEASLVNQRQDLREQQQAFDMQRAEAEQSVAPQRDRGMAL